MTAHPLALSPAPGKAALWMLGALLSFSSIAIAGREVSFELNTFQLMFFRSIFGLLIVLAIASATKGGVRRLKTERLGLHLVRNCAHFLGQFCWFFAVALIPLSEVFALEFTVPIWVALFAPLVLRERLTKMRILAALLGFAGAMIVVRPGGEPLGPGTISAIIAAFGFAGAILATKKLSATETPLTIIFYMTLIQLPMGLLPALDGFVWPTGATWFWLVVVSAAGLSAHFCMAQAFRLGDAMLVVPMDFLRLPLIAVVGMLFYNEPLDLYVFLGGLLIIGGVYGNVLYESRGIARAKRPTP